jgi:AcrR family transcriptional regulator
VTARARGGVALADAVDGRARRSQRSRAALVDAMYALVGEGVLQPTASQVADRAGIGLRSVFRHFDDMDGLYAEIYARVAARAVPFLASDPCEGPLEARACELVARRAKLFEEIAPYKRAGLLQRWRSRFVAKHHADLVRRLRDGLLRALPELRDAPDAVVDALDVALSFETWERLRVDQRLGRERAAAALERTVLALLGEERTRWAKSR